MKQVSSTWYYVGMGALILLGTEILGVTSIISRVSAMFSGLLKTPTTKPTK